ncbi:DUF47 domain-containing protein [Desulforamulus aquiferis]|uniref:DUF47 family protein n=1 Tax=Desulforamulus aquiferis TaxID=1397668 RepID=A0AAW7ZB14_9FIRM|nr:DUF47 family protein [Desulforamulus aquiferis]MDO7786314.1 DUF47 family protein [Desulforamulus aquiferis]
MFLRKKDVFHKTFEDISLNLIESAEILLSSFHSQDPSFFLNNIHFLEKKTNRLVEVIIKELNSTFVTPLERDDIFHLAIKLDKILDLMEKSAVYLATYESPRVPDFEKIANIILSCCKEIKNSIEKLSRKKFSDVRLHTTRIYRLEQEARSNLFQSLKFLSTTSEEPLLFIKYRDILILLGQILASLVEAAHCLNIIILKNC